MGLKDFVTIALVVLSTKKREDGGGGQKLFKITLRLLRKTQ